MSKFVVKNRLTADEAVGVPVFTSVSDIIQWRDNL